MTTVEVPPAPPVAAKSYPPLEPALFPRSAGYRPPSNLVIPPIPGVIPPPICVDRPETPENECNGGPPPEQPPPEQPPPEDVPEPGALLILMAGAAAIWLTRKRKPATAKK